MYTLAHISDPHLSDWRVASVVELAGKRVFGFFSWQLKRRRIHRAEILELLVRDLLRAAPDHIAVTGDIVNISLSDEFAAAAHWLATVGSPERVTVVPGNHDAYVAIPWDSSLARWAAYMAGDSADPNNSRTAAASEFPFLRRRGPLAIVGVSTAAPMPYRSAGGVLGTAQLARLETMLTALGREPCCRVVLIHHPPQPSATPDRKALADAAGFRAAIARAGAELILHGHTHRAHLDRLATPAGYAPVLGVPSASALPHKGKHPARYHLFRFAPAAPGWHIEVEVRGLAPSCREMRTETRFALEIARPKVA